MKRFIKHKSDKGAVLIAAASPLLIILFIFWESSIFTLSIIWAALWVITCRNNYILHNHVHVPMLDGKIANKIFDILLALSTAMPAGNWKIMHVHGHHVEHKVQTLASRSFVMDFMVPSYHKVKWYNGFNYSIFRVPLQFFYPIKILGAGLISSWSAKRIWARYYLLDYLALAAFVSLLAIHNFERVLFGVIPIYILVYFVSIYIDFYTHVREHNTLNSGITFSNVCHNSVYNKMFWNFGHHVGHHSNPSTHWSELPEVEKRMGVVQSDDEAFRALNIFGLFRPMHNVWRIPVWGRKKNP